MHTHTYIYTIMHKPTISTHAYVDTMVDTVYTSARRGGFQTLGAAAGHLAAPFCHGDVQLPCLNMGWNGDAAIAGWFTMEHPMNMGDIYRYFMRIHPLVHEQFDPKVSQWPRGHESSKHYLPGPMLIYWRVVRIVWFGCLWNWDIPGICRTFSRVYMMLCEPIDLWIRDSEMPSFETNPHLEVTETQHVCDHPDS